MTFCVTLGASRLEGLHRLEVQTPRASARGTRLTWPVTSPAATTLGADVR